MLTGALKSVFALSEAYPDLKANQNFLNLQEELTGTEDRIAYSRQFYNDTVNRYNTKIQTFPAVAHRRHVPLHRARVLRGRRRVHGVPSRCSSDPRGSPASALYDQVASEQAPLVPADRHLRGAHRGGGGHRDATCSSSARRLRDRRGHRHRRVGAVVLEVRRGRPGHEPGQARPTRRSTRGSTTWSRASASPAACPSPASYVVDDAAPNAFATGRDPKHAAIAVTTGLLEKMNRVELEGVLAHELSHIKNYDILVSTLAVTMVGVVALMADLGIRMLWWNGGRRGRDDDRRRERLRLRWPILGFVLLILAPIIGRLHAVRGEPPPREPLADVSGVEMTRYPPGLISALEKLQRRHHGRALGLAGHRPPVDRGSRWPRTRRRAGCRSSTGCSTPIRRSRSASPPSGSCDGRRRCRDCASGRWGSGPTLKPMSDQPATPTPATADTGTFRGEAGPGRDAQGRRHHGRRRSRRRPRSPRTPAPSRSWRSSGCRPTSAATAAWPA